jgi:hypothetical protein
MITLTVITISGAYCSFKCHPKVGRLVVDDVIQRILQETAESKINLIILTQLFSTGVPRNPSVSWAASI